MVNRVDTNSISVNYQLLLRELWSRNFLVFMFCSRTIHRY